MNAQDRAALLAKLFWHLQTPWHFRQPPQTHALSLRATVQGLQALLLAQDGAFLLQTLRQANAPAYTLEALQRLDIALYQEGIDQRVWRAQATFAEGPPCLFGLIVARAPGDSSVVTQNDFHHLQALRRLQPRYCVTPYQSGMAPVAGGVAAYTVEWLEQYKELVFEVTRHGGVFFINAVGAQRQLSPQASRQIWRALAEILCWYPGLRAVNIQAGDFVGYLPDEQPLAVKLTTARQLIADPDPEMHLQALLGCMITASGYLSDGRQPFDRRMPEAVFVHRMQAVLRRRFGAQAPRMTRQQWSLFQAGAFAQQEDWLKTDCLLAVYNRWRAELPTALAWQETRCRWLAYAAAVQAGRLTASWWFPAAEIAPLLAQLAPRLAPPSSPTAGMQEE